MRELGYVPNQLAVALARARNPFDRRAGCRPSPIRSSPIRAGAVRRIGAARLRRDPGNSRATTPHVKITWLSALLSRRPEAIIMVGSPATEDGARLLRRAGIPVAETWDLPATPIDAVAGFNNYEAGAAVARHLVEQGRNSLAFIGRRRSARHPDVGMDSTTRRRRLAPKRRAGWSWTATPPAVSSRLQNWPGVDAVFAANDAHCHRLHVPVCERRASCVTTARPRSNRSRSSASRSRNGPSDRTKSLHIRVHGDAIGRTAAN